MYFYITAGVWITRIQKSRWRQFGVKRLNLFLFGVSFLCQKSIQASEKVAIDWRIGRWGGTLWVWKIVWKIAKGYHRKNITTAVLRKSTTCCVFPTNENGFVARNHDKRLQSIGGYGSATSGTAVMAAVAATYWNRRSTRCLMGLGLFSMNTSKQSDGKDD